MKKIKILESKGNTFYVKGRYISKGCQLCLKGAKAVLFLNGICQIPDHCSWYCPISEERRNKDITYADEIEIKSNKELLIELDTIKARGISITGGDPLLERNIQKTLEYIKYVKTVKGKTFHVHLYTNGINFNESLANNLANAGLDEIRFHPPQNKWENIKFALNKGMSVGAEVPVIPSKEYIETLEKFILFLDNIGAEFINLNEFEYCIPNNQSLKIRGFKLKEGSLAVVENSKEMAFNLLNEMAPKVSLKMHFCTIRAKDHYQLKNRYLRRAKTIRLPYEEITDEGLLIYAQIEGSEEVLNLTKNLLISDFKISRKLINQEKNKLQLPYYVALEDKFISFLEKNRLNGYIIEMIPIRGQYNQITEQTPIKEFKKELYDN
jgi:pyruvate formate-lyase activating enzyme-like uncharacterized protein